MTSTKRVVINASPLITLCRSQLHGLLPQLFEAVYVPDAVWQEVVNGGKDDAAARIVPTLGWLQRLPPVEVALDIQRWNLGAGESAVMHHARELTADRAILDDAAARRCARSINIAMTGTCGVIVLAKRRGLLPKAEPAFRQLQAAGLWLSEELIAALLQEAGEHPSSP
jgi:predicted nucleic acid-binding protein